MVRRTLKRAIKRLVSGSVWSRVICWRGPGRDPLVAVTFDDGPDAVWTPAVLDILDRFDAPATFFVQGNRVAASPELVRRIAAAGHEIGSHGFDHTRRDAPAQATRGDEALRAVGISTRLFRPPGGALGAGSLLWLARSGFTTVLWSFDAVDSMREEGKWAGAIPDYADVSAGDIVLMHDDNATCVRDLPVLLEALQRKGLRPVHVSRLIGRPSRSRPAAPAAHEA